MFFVTLYKENSPSVLKTLKCSNKTVNYTKKLWGLINKNPSLSKPEFCKCFYEFGEDVCAPFFEYLWGNSALTLIKEIKTGKLPCSLKELNIKGSDLAFKGKDIKTALTSALFAVMEGKIKNEKSELLKYINSIQENTYE